MNFFDEKRCYVVLFVTLVNFSCVNFLWISQDLEIFTQYMQLVIYLYTKSCTLFLSGSHSSGWSIITLLLLLPPVKKKKRCLRQDKANDFLAICFACLKQQKVNPSLFRFRNAKSESIFYAKIPLVCLLPDL